MVTNNEGGVLSFSKHALSDHITVIV